VATYSSSGGRCRAAAEAGTAATAHPSVDWATHKLTIVILGILPILINTIQGTRRPRAYQYRAYFRIRTTAIPRKVVLPASMPLILPACASASRLADPGHRREAPVPAASAISSSTCNALFACRICMRGW
jgi:hypothetical protein